MNFGDEHIRLATINDLAAIEHLLNSSYRGELSKKGWTTEADLIAGETRTDHQSLLEVFNKTGSVFLKYVEGEQLSGCVNLQQVQDKVYLGMFAVSPILQGAGIGKKLLIAAEKYTAEIGCKAIFMSVVSVRQELIDWYLRHGYKDTGEKKAFMEDAVSGKHLRPLEFSILEKTIE